MKQIHKAVQALESDIGYWGPSWILLKKLKSAEKIHRANFPGPVFILQIFRNNPSRGVWLYNQILMIAKISNTEISAKILKHKKVSIIRITPKAFQLYFRVRYLLPNMKQIDEAIQALACAIGFWWPSWILLKKLKNAKKNLSGKFPRASMHTANIWE